jgi:hypothetical protein
MTRCWRAVSDRGARRAFPIAMATIRSRPASWPALPLDEWRDTAETLHRWMQVVGKLKLALSPTVNHWWNVAFTLTARGLTTGQVPYGDRWFDLEFDLVEHRLHVRTSDGRVRDLRLEAKSVAAFYRELVSVLGELAIEVRIWPVPVEIEDPIRLDQDEQHRSYEASYVDRFWRVVARTATVLDRFRARFVGKASPTQFWWGTFDLSTNRFSGRRAPGSEALGTIEREAYSHEVVGAGWWPGDSRLPEPAFFAYIAPEPAGLAEARLEIPGARYLPALHGWYLPLDDLRRDPAPDATLLELYQRTYEHAATLAGWDRAALDRRTVP